MTERTYSVPAMHCSHCEAAVTRELEAVDGVQRVIIDTETKLVVVQGGGLDSSALVAAIDEAGYDAEEVPT
jgi:copper chaperone